MPRIHKFASLLALGVTLAAATSSHAVVIDDFSVGPIALEHTIVDNGFETATQIGLDPAHVAGGVRKWRYDVAALPTADPVSTAAVRMTVSQDPAPHYLYDADDVVTAVNFDLEYDANNDAIGQPGINVNLATERHNAIVLEVTSASFVGLSALDMYVDAPSLSTIYKGVPLPSSTTPYRAYMLLSNTKGVAPSSVRSVRLGSSNGNLFGTFELGRIVTGSTADADFDGDADGGDFLIWQRNLGLTLPAASSEARIAAGDANLDGVVNNADLAIWRNSVRPATAASAVPEPGAAALAALAFLRILYAPRTRRSAA